MDMMKLRLLYAAEVGRYGEIRGDMGRCREIRGDVGHDEAAPALRRGGAAAPNPNPYPNPNPHPTPTPTPNPTQAAPSFFPGCVLPAARGEPTRVLQDGALLANNPAAVALREAHALFPGRP